MPQKLLPQSCDVGLRCEMSARTLLLLNGLNKDNEAIAPLFKIRSLGLRPLETLVFKGRTPS